MAQNTEWQDIGGIIEIPDGWFVHGANFDADEPFILMTKNDGRSNSSEYEKKVFVPKALAYYLSTHFCGSTKMADRLIEQGKWNVRNKIQDALGLTDKPWKKAHLIQKRHLTI